MLEQQQMEEAKQAAFSIPPPACAAPVLLSPPAQILIARYLAQNGDAQVSDTRARLETLTLAYSELDPAPQQAVDAAIRHLESERQTAALGEQAARHQAFHQRERTRSAVQSARPATLTALKLFGPGALAIPATVAVMSMLHYEVGSLFVAWLYFLYLGLPALLGVGVGMRVRHRPAMGTFCAVGVLTPLVSLVASLALGSSGWQDNLVQLAMLMLLFWMPIGVAAAGLTGWGRDTLRRKRRQKASTRGIRLKE